jgi:uncharacterized protein (DUF1800 family)
LRREAIIAVNRFGLGAAPGELAAAAKRSARLACRANLEARARSSGIRRACAVERNAEGIPALGCEPAPGARDASATMRADGQPAVRGIEQNFRDFFGPGMLKEVGARLAAGASTPAPFHERLALFWANHFTVSAEKPVIFAVVGSFEREAIRPHVAGTFVDMLIASSKHPAMILYLDNNLSVKPGFTGPPNAGGNAPRLTGLNENLAREILELHTLGVNGGYTQADVTTFARVLTGWTVGGRANPGFRSLRRGTIPAPRRFSARPTPTTESRRAKRCCATWPRIPATATFIATKLARHFIADERQRPRWSGSRKRSATRAATFQPCTPR